MNWVYGEEVKNEILKLRARPTQHMLVASLWSRCSGRGAPNLPSFAAITHEPPPEVSTAWHDRCIMPIKPEHVDASLKPDPKYPAAQYAKLDDRELPYDENLLAA